MSLDFDLTNITDYEDVCFVDDHLSSITNALIFATMAVDMGEITEANAVEFAERLRAWENVCGNFLVTHDGDPRPLTFDDVRHHIGLRCNVATTTKAKFRTKLAKTAMDSAHYQIAKEVAA